MITAVYTTNDFFRVQPVTPVSNVRKLQDQTSEQDSKQQSSDNSFFQMLMSIQAGTAAKPADQCQSTFSYSRNAKEIFFDTINIMDYRC